MKDKVTLQCGCGASFERDNISEEHRQWVGLRLFYKYCDTCFHNLAKRAMTKLPEVLKSFADTVDPPQTPTNAEAK